MFPLRVIVVDTIIESLKSSSSKTNSKNIYILLNQLKWFVVKKNMVEDMRLFLLFRAYFANKFPCPQKVTLMNQNEY